MNIRLASIAMSAAAIGVLAGCSSASSASGSATQSASASGASSSATPAPATTPATTPSAVAAFVPIVEPFDPGHPARAISYPPTCDGQSTTLAIVQCYEHQTETWDHEIDLVQNGRYQTASASQQAAINAEDTAWLAARQTVCEKAYQTGGTIDQINIASCLLDESTAWLLWLRGSIPPEAVLKSTDSTSLSDVAWYTTPEGTRIGLIDTQGDQTGGTIIAWVIIAGADGFVVNPAQFYYGDGTFTDKGILQPPAGASGHHVAAGTEYQFSIDYSTLQSDPNKTKGTGGWVYAPVNPVAIWR